MADIVGAAGGNLGGLTGAGASRREWWTATLHEPIDGYPTPTVSPVLYTSAITWDASDDPSVQVQVSTSNTFGTTVHDSTAIQPHGDVTGRQVFTLSNGVTYYWRARAGLDGLWGPWTPTETFVVRVDQGKAFLQMQVNVGVTLTSDRDTTQQIQTNVNPGDTRRTYWPVYSTENVGVVDDPASYWAASSTQNVTTDTPSPRIWFLRPAAARAGDGVEIVGWGFGDLQTTFSGVVEMDWGGEIGWQPVLITSWQTFPADPPAYTEDRELDESTGKIDPMHTVIQFTVPDGAIPPGYPVRVRTDGP